jgi:hypothetical protein
MKMKWPWTKLAEKCNYLLNRIQTIEDVLCEARVARFIRVRHYKKGDSLEDGRPLPISLVDLEERIHHVEEMLPPQPHAVQIEQSPKYEPPQPMKEALDRLPHGGCVGIIQHGSLTKYFTMAFKEDELTLDEIRGAFRDGAEQLAISLDIGLPRVDKDGTFHCRCGAQHSRGPINGADGYRCLSCGYIGSVNKESHDKESQEASEAQATK